MLPVYCEHFGLTREPFKVTPDPSFLYFSASHKEALAQLVYGITTRRGFVVLTGEVGTGKTTLIQSLLEEINDGHTRCAFLFDLTGSPKDLLRSLCEEFALTAPLDKEKDVPNYLALINRFLLDTYQKGDNVAVIIDEAQNLSAEVLERVRLLSNFETKQDKLLQIVLVGQPELTDRLNQPELRQLKQRVALRHHLSPLNLSECKEYIARRLEISGGTDALFSTGALEALHGYSGGIPRLVNILCDNGLLSAYALRKPAVEAAMIGEIAQDLHLTPARRSVVLGRESVVVEPREASLRGAKLRFELTDRAAAERQDRVISRPFGAEPTSGAEPSADSSKTTRQVLEVPRHSENGATMGVERAADVVPNRFFEYLIGRLTEAVGPMAFIIVKDCVAAMGESPKAFPTHRLRELVEETSREIAIESMKETFTQLMAREIQALNGGKSHDTKQSRRW